MSSAVTAMAMAAVAMAMAAVATTVVSGEGNNREEKFVFGRH